ncbi:hypothetical protein PRIPAC_95168 [Pristionchus pacificus]|uniref:Uncharacterized protein n=1 Tax=Pristionchus pacificus TaxID=54126 RepID=A0A8R1Z3S8_PRIPA|nr:hypothetical protein PRIPAC_95168 [Pristionchus pacificus]
MGGCSSCLRLLLNEADVKIHVIEPTSVMGGADNTETIAIQPSASTLQVPPLNRPRTPSDTNTQKTDSETKDEAKDGEKDDEKEDGEKTEEMDENAPVATLQIPDMTQVRTIPVKPKTNSSDSVE